jgi:hypothetical protein
MFWSHSFVADRCIYSSLKVVVNLYNVFIVTLFAVTVGGLIDLAPYFIYLLHSLSFILQ